jgi:uncharacterized membrane protein
MPVSNSASFSKTLRSEVPSWVEQGIIDDKSAESLLALYPLVESKSRLIGIITIFGSVLIGLGVLLFVGSNWEKLSAFFKLALIISAIAAANFGGWHFSIKDNSRPKVGNSLFLLGGLLYGAGIWLVAQTFQLDLDWSLGMTLWSVGLIPVAMLIRSVPLAVLNGLVMLCWSVSGHHLPAISIIVAGIAVALAYFLRSRFTLVLALLQGVLFCTHFEAIGQDYNMDPYMAVLFYTAGLFTWYIWHREHKPSFAAPYLYVSLIVSLMAFLLVTFFSTTGHASWQDPPLIAQIIFSIASGFYVISNTKKYVPEILGGYIAILVTVALLFASGSALPVRFLENVVLFASLIGLIYSGARRLDSAAMVNISTVFFAIAIFCRYFDTFYQMLDRSVFFLVGGTVLLVGGYLLEQQRRTLIRGLNQ